MTTAQPERLLAIDVGNTQTALGVFERETLLGAWRLATRREQTADEYGILVRGVLAASGFELQSLNEAIVASVVPPLTPVMEALCSSLLGREPLVVGPGVRTGMAVLYDPPGDVGADRIVNAVAAFSQWGGPVVVVDFGTATTFDVVSAKGEYLGGVICPGVGISADALFKHAARLPRVETRDPGRVVGRSTVASMQSGLYFGYAAMVEGLLERIRREMGGDVRVVATGGLAELLVPEMPSIEAVEPALTLRGLRLIWERNRQEPRS